MVQSMEQLWGEIATSAIVKIGAMDVSDFVVGYRMMEFGQPTYS